jgi:hypothetical protein
MSERDPIFALIEKQRRLEAAHERACRAATEQKREAACRAAGDGLRELVNTTPTTVGGVRAVLWYVSTELGYGQDVPERLIECMRSCAVFPPIFGVANVRPHQAS